MTPDLPNIENTPWFIQIAFNWLKGQPVVSILVTLMFLDTASGIFLAIAKKTLNSTISWSGNSKKALMLLIVSAAGIFQSLAPAFPVMNMMASFYVVTELLSLLENAAAAGVPLPPGLIATLQKLRDQRAVIAMQKGSSLMGISQTTNIFPPVAAGTETTTTTKTTTPPTSP